MQQLLKQIIRKTPLYPLLRDWLAKRKLAEWEKNGKPVPPPHLVKQQTLRTYSKKFGLNILVETGTLHGDMVEAMKKDFEKIYSIELSKDLYEKAKTRFTGQDNVEIIQGDSSIELERLMDRINQPTLFWLDGHYSGGVTARGEKDTPIYDELRHILNAPDSGHVIIIDDARNFGTDPAYPSIEELSEFIKGIRPNLNIAIQDDSVRISLQS
jgi:hypothetical protein